MFRYEKKAIVSKRTEYLINNSLKSVLQIDPNSDGKYLVRSVYFDDIHKSSYYDVIEDAYDRKKYRIRAYDKSSEVIFLEEKRKINNKIYKTRERLTLDEYNLIMSGEVDFLRNKSEIGTRFYTAHRTNVLRPKILIEYERMAYTHKESDIRVTLDENIRVYKADVGLFGDSDFSYLVNRDNPTVLEIKYHDYVPSVVNMIFQKSTILNTNFSKYVQSYERMYQRRNWR